MSGLGELAPDPRVSALERVRKWLGICPGVAYEELETGLDEDGHYYLAPGLKREFDNALAQSRPNDLVIDATIVTLQDAAIAARYFQRLAAQRERKLSALNVMIAHKHDTLYDGAGQPTVENFDLYEIRPLEEYELRQLGERDLQSHALGFARSIVDLDYGLSRRKELFNDVQQQERLKAWQGLSFGQRLRWYVRKVLFLSRGVHALPLDVQQPHAAVL